MNMVTTALLCLLSGALFDVSEIPVDSRQAVCFMAAGPTGRTDLMVLSGNQLKRYPSANFQRGQVLRLDEGTSAFDIADLDDDEIPEVVAIQGTAIKRFSYGADSGSAETLFELETLFTAASTPFPRVLVLPFEEKKVLALPRRDALELRHLDGSLAARFPVGRDAPLSMSFGRPFSARVVDPPEVAAPGGLEFRVNTVIARLPSLPETLAPGMAPLGPGYRYGTRRQAREALGQPVRLWPWFPLAPDGASRVRALYATENAHVTVVRIQGDPGTPQGSSHVGPPRRYPGQMLTAADVFPDFNGDGLTDLLLWDAPDPSPSIGMLTRALATRSWPLRMTVHLYDARHRRFSAKPAGILQLRSPVAWFLEQPGRPPIRHMVLADFDGDGQTDLACSTTPQTYSVWCWGEKGFNGPPDFSCVLGENLLNVAFRADLDGSGRTSLGLRGASKIHVLQARAGATPP